MSLVASRFPFDFPGSRPPCKARQIVTGALATKMGSIVLACAVVDKNLSDEIKEKSDHD